MKFKKISPYERKSQIRKSEISSILKSEIARRVMESANCLELGAGDLVQSKHLKQAVRTLVSVEINYKRLVSMGVPSGYSLICADALELPFPDSKFDLIFTSNMLEHVGNFDQLLQEMIRVIKPDGYMIHVMPSVTWKVIHIILYPMALIRNFLYKKLISPNRSERLTNNFGPRTLDKKEKRMIRRLLLPKVHGEYADHLDEIVNYRKTNWRYKFTSPKLVEILVSDKMPFHTPYRFGFKRLAKILESLGMSSTTYFIYSVKK